MLWFANQRAVEYHPTLFRGHADDGPTHLVLDLDPPARSDAFPRAVEAALLVRHALADAGMSAMVKTSGAKGVHVFVPLEPGQSAMDVAAATRAIAVRAERLDPSPGDDGVRRRGAWRQGLPRLDASRRRHRGGGVQPATATWSAGVVPAALGGPR